MNESAKNMNAQPEDVDLLLLIERAILFFRKYKWIFIVAGLLGISLGIFSYLTLPKIYKSKLILHSFILTNQEEIQILNNWKDLLNKKEYADLAGIFHCPENILYSVRQMKVEEIQKVFTPANPNGFFIEVMVTDNSILKDLQNGIVYGLENSEYIKEKVATKRTNLAELIEKTKFEIKKLDSTKKILENIISGKGKSSSSLIVDGSAINRQLIEMNEKLLSFETDLKFSNAIQVLQSFSKFKRPVGPRLMVRIVLGLVVSLSLAYLYALYNTIKERLKKHSRESSSVLPN
jgi:hypothetical protein